MDMITLAMLNSMKKTGGVGYVETPESVALPETELIVTTAANSYGTYSVNVGKIAPQTFAEGRSYTVIFDGVEYKNMPCAFLGTVLHIGNASLYGNNADTGEPFDFRMQENGRCQVFVRDSETHTISIVTPETVHPIAPKYIPPLDSLTLNGADGKQYKLSVDESGQLVTAAIE